MPFSDLSLASLFALLDADSESLERHIGDLDVAARAALVRKLAVGRTSSRDERAIAAIFLATSGAALSDLKEAIESSSDYHDLLQLLYHDIDASALRTAILQHIAANSGPPSGLKVLSDIDDTFFENWVDKRYPAKTVYPGVRQLYAELSGSPSDCLGAVVTFVTARPEDPLGLIEDSARRSLAERGVPRARVLSGSFTHLLGNAAIAREKFLNFERYRGVFPEFRFVFFGDSGQGDIFFGQEMREKAPSVVPLVLIHDVVATPEERRAELRASEVHLFDTYAGAALVAFEKGLIPAEGLNRVAAAARVELSTVPFASQAQRAAREADLCRDLERISAALATCPPT